MAEKNKNIKEYDRWGKTCMKVVKKPQEQQTKQVQQTKKKVKRGK